MALISFGYRVNIYAPSLLPTDPAGYIVAYDVDGVLKQKDYQGVVTLVGVGAGGAQGPPGPVGPAGLTWSGYWIATQSYSENYAVGYGSASWWCILGVTGATGNDSPDIDTTHWTLLAAQGSPGSQGAQGEHGLDGPQGLTGATGPTGATGAGVTSSFYLQGTTDYSYDTSSDIYRTGSLVIGTSASSTSKLYVYATQSGALRLVDGTQGPGKVLTSDATGVASWTPLSSVGISGTAGFIPKFTGTSSLGNSRFKDNGTTGSYEISANNGVYFLSGANTYLTLDRGQSAMSFYLGNGQISQASKITSTNTFGLDIESTGYISFKTGSTSSFVVDNNGTYNNSRGLNNTSFGYQSLYNDTTLISSYSILNAGSGYTASSTYSNVQLSYISGSRALTYPIATIYVGSTGSVSIVTLVTSGKGYIDNTTVMGANLEPLTGGVTFSVKIDSLVGNYNTAIGNGSLYSNTIGSNNTAVGFGAGNLISGTTSGATQSNNSVFIGYDTRPQANGQTNQIVIGYGATGNGSDSVTLGNDSIIKTYLKGNIQLPTVPTTSVGTYSILTRNNITGEVEKIIPTYKVYTALITQSGTASPTLVPLENTLEQTVTVTRSNSGRYALLVSGAILLATKTWWTITNDNNNGFIFYMNKENSFGNTNTVYIDTAVIGGTYTDGVLQSTPIEIRVYN
jgi:hypothetical protein